MMEWIDLVPLIMSGILYLLGMPMVYSLLGPAFFYFMYLDPSKELWVILQNALKPIHTSLIITIPLFIMAGSIMSHSGVNERMLRFAEVLAGHKKGALAQINVVLSMLLGGCSGSANSDCAMQSRLLVPEMERKGYSKAFSAAITAASSAVTPVIPPGVNLMVYALIAGISLERLFAAGYIPGALMALCMMLVVSVISGRRDYPALYETRAETGEILRRGLRCLWGPIFPIGFIIGVRFGIFTPAEGGALAVLYCIFVGKLIYGQLSLKRYMIPVLLESISGTAHVMLLLLAVNVFEEYLRAIQVFDFIETALLSVSTGKYVFLLIANLCFLIMGMFIEGGISLMLLTPLFLPVAKQLGIDPVHFGLVAVVNVMIGGITPPFGSLMFTTCAITRCPTLEFLKEVWPFILGLLAVLLLCIFCPALVTAIPALLWGNV